MMALRRGGDPLTESRIVHQEDIARRIRHKNSRTGNLRRMESRVIENPLGGRAGLPMDFDFLQTPIATLYNRGLWFAPFWPRLHLTARGAFNQVTRRVSRRGRWGNTHHLICVED